MLLSLLGSSSLEGDFSSKKTRMDWNQRQAWFETCLISKWRVYRLDQREQYDIWVEGGNFPASDFEYVFLRNMRDSNWTMEVWASTSEAWRSILCVEAIYREEMSLVFPDLWPTFILLRLTKKKEAQPFRRIFQVLAADLPCRTEAVWSVMCRTT